MLVLILLEQTKDIYIPIKQTRGLLVIVIFVLLIKAILPTETTGLLVIIFVVVVITMIQIPSIILIKRVML